MTTDDRPLSPQLLPRVLAAVVALLLLITGGYVVIRLVTTNDRTITAYFSETISVYQGSDVRIFGVKVGSIDSVTPAGTQVRVVMSVDKKYPVSSTVHAIVVPPSVVSDRYIQLSPAFTGGPQMGSTGTIPLSRTAVPVELDQVYSSLDKLSTALGPNGANADGSLNQLLKVGADNLQGQGQNLQTTLHNLSEAASTLDDSRGDLFGTVRNLQTFTTALASSDKQVRAFNADLASVSEQLDGERTDLALALRNLSVALGQVTTYIQQNKSALVNDVEGLKQITGILAQQKSALSSFLDVAPLAVSNLQDSYNPTSGTLDTRAVNFNNDLLPTFLCELLNSTLDKVAPGALRTTFTGLLGSLTGTKAGELIPCKALTGSAATTVLTGLVKGLTSSQLSQLGLSSLLSAQSAISGATGPGQTVPTGGTGAPNATGAGTSGGSTTGGGGLVDTTLAGILGGGR